MRRSFCLIMLAVAGCHVPLPDPTPAPVPPSPPSPNVVQDLITAHNKFRLEHGVRPLTADAHLQSACEAHARDMASHGTMSHTGSDGSSPFQRMTEAGYPWSSAGENVAWNQPNVASVMSAWQGSFGHRRNILDGSFVNISAAMAKGSDGSPYWCVDFGAPARTAAAPGEPKVTTQEMRDTSSTSAVRP